MARSQRKFFRKYNETLDFLASGGTIDSVLGFSADLDISRTLARSIIAKLDESQVIRGGEGPLIRPIQADDYYPRHQVLEPEEILRSDFMNWIIREKLAPGTIIDETRVATRLRIPVSSVHEFLIGLSKFGFFRKERGREWKVQEISDDFVKQLLDLRLRLELDSIPPLVELTDNDPFWRTLRNLEQQHIAMIEADEGGTIQFTALDNSFHSLLNSASNNRFMQIFQEAVFFVFYYHYQWEDVGERRRNVAAVNEHMGIIEALFQRDREGARSALETHLLIAQQTLLDSLERR